MVTDIGSANSDVNGFDTRADTSLIALSLPIMYIPADYLWRNPIIASSTVFISNRSQAVRLPKAVAFPDDVHQVDILKIGRSRVIAPHGKRWDDLFLAGPRASSDFMAEREQPPSETREFF